MQVKHKFCLKYLGISVKKKAVFINYLNNKVSSPSQLAYTDIVYTSTLTSLQRQNSANKNFSGTDKSCLFGACLFPFEVNYGWYLNNYGRKISEHKLQWELQLLIQVQNVSWVHKKWLAITLRTRSRKRRENGHCSQGSDFTLFALMLLPDWRKHTESSGPKPELSALWTAISWTILQFRGSLHPMREKPNFDAATIRFFSWF